MESVWKLFANSPRNQHLVHGFNIFLPSGYRVECGLEPDVPNTVRIVTPTGAVVHKTEYLWLSFCALDFE